jgi:hypothetical protein
MGLPYQYRPRLHISWLKLITVAVMAASLVQMPSSGAAAGGVPVTVGLAGSAAAMGAGEAAAVGVGGCATGAAVGLGGIAAVGVVGSATGAAVGVGGTSTVGGGGLCSSHVLLALAVITAGGASTACNGPGLCFGGADGSFGVNVVGGSIMRNIGLVVLHCHWGSSQQGSSSMWGGVIARQGRGSRQGGTPLQGARPGGQGRLVLGEVLVEVQDAPENAHVVACLI